MRPTRFDFRAALVPLAGIFALLLVPGATASAQEQDEEYLQRGENVFERQCAACHSLGGGDLVGPDLAGIMEKRTREYVRRFILEPNALKAEDETAREVGERFPSAMAPIMLSDENMEALLAYLEAMSDVEIELEPEEVAQITDELIEKGRAIFLGTSRLEHGGPSCISCHNVAGDGGLGGGNLGIDLTDAYRRFTASGNPNALLTTIQNPAFPMMREAYDDKPITEEEALALNAYFASVSDRSPEDERGWGELFLILGVLGGILFLGVFDFIWRKRFTAVRKPLVEGARR